MSSGSTACLNRLVTVEDDGDDDEEVFVCRFGVDEPATIIENSMIIENIENTMIIENKLNNNHTAEHRSSIKSSQGNSA